MNEQQLRQTIFSMHADGIKHEIDRRPGIQVARFSGDWGMGCGHLHVGVDRASLSRYDVEVTLAWLTRKNWPTGLDPVVMEATFPTLSRNDVRELAAFFTLLGEEMDAWEYKPQAPAGEGE